MPAASVDDVFQLCSRSAGQLTLHCDRLLWVRRYYKGEAVLAASVDDVFQLCSRSAEQFTFHCDCLSVGEKVS